MTTSNMPRPSRQAALSALEQYLPNAGRAYAKSRNFDYGPDRRDNVSVLSPYVSHRLLLEAELLERVLGRHSFGEAQKFIEEVYWRSYFKGWLEQH
ncbi:MAG: DNA photolyase FAD-binding protein, partial [Woeseiaceae bacterium]|nr:DNA photolyase FAD-binding protein [Woeseiaceae bacterium]